MKITSLLETSAGATGSGSVATVASPVGGVKKRGGSMFTGKTTNKPFYEEKDHCDACDHPSDECTCEKTNEGAMPQAVIKTKEKIRLASDEENKKRFAGKTKEEIAAMARRHGYGSKNPYAKFHDGVTDVKESRIMRGMLEADLHEDDLILMPGQGARFKRELMPKKTDHEIEMARGQLYQSAKNAKDICDMLQGVSEIQGIDAWVQSKITTAADYLETVRAYLESKYEMQDEVDEATSREKFNRGLKQSGYDPHKGADRLLNLIAKQKREREKFEKELPLVYGDKEKEVKEGFNSKQEVIDHFIKQGKSAASGAAAWERGWRGAKPKKKELRPPVRSYHDDLDDKRYGDQTMEESVSDLKKQIAKYEELALAANRAGDDVKCKQYQKKIQSLKSTSFEKEPKGEYERKVDKYLKKKYNMEEVESVEEEKVRLDPKCWKGKHKEGTKMKGGIRVNNCVPNESIEEEKPGLWANIHAKRERIKHGSGERMRKPGSKGAPTDAALTAAKKK